MLQIERLYKRCGSTFSLDVDLTLEEGMIYGLTGPGGAGKTTLLEILAGLVKADGGMVLLNDVNILRSHKVNHQYTGYMPDHFGTYQNLKVIEYLEFFAHADGMYGLKARTRCTELLSMVHMENQAEKFLDELTRGMRKRLNLVRSILHEPKLLLLDEPLAGVEAEIRFELQEIIKQLAGDGVSIIITSQMLSEIMNFANFLCMMDKGRIRMQGTFESIANEARSVNPLYITVYGGLPQAIALMRLHPLVKTLSVDGKKIMIRFSGGEKEEAELLKELIASGVSIQAFYRDQSNLELQFGSS